MVTPSSVEKTPHTPEQPPKSTGSVVNSPHPTPPEVKSENATVSSNSTPPSLPVLKRPILVSKDATVSSNSTPPSLPVLKRPILVSKDYETTLEEEDLSLDLLYDYTTLNAWLDHPVKKFKLDLKENQRTSMLGKDLYSMFSQNGVPNITNDTANMLGNIKKEPFLAQEIKQEPTDMETDTPPILQNSVGHDIKRPGDPYEFDEEGASGACHMDGFKRAAIAVKEEPKDLKKLTTGNLFTSEGLQPSYKDLDQIFDNSDDTSSDEAAHIQTPPGSNKSSGHHEDNKRLSGHNNSSSGCPTMGILRPEELSKMFPTPPSLEHNPIASPIGTHDLPPPDMTELSIIRVKQDIYPNMGSPQEENIEDWSYVFKPPTICKMVGSSISEI
ncbi:hypothetical protein QE152_g25955 [Popillia japonica]|uniref:Mediator of RNA polymerase II transcription subunit 13 n=1 Tax=Popillia japonica TaxID=7064 RepID=A0AAW1JZX1_POPJA